MEELFQYQNTLLAQVSDKFKRYLFHQLPWQDRFICIKGLRGVGKTTMMLQYLKYVLKDTTKNLYVTLDHPYFYTHDLMDLAKEFSLQGGEVLLVDEVHKVRGWSRTIKYLFDAYPNLQIILSSSSALDILQGEADLSRRVAIYNMGGLSFREFLVLMHGMKVEPLMLEQILENHIQIATDLKEKWNLIPLFSEYLKYGYYPFSKTLQVHSFKTRLIQALNTTLNVDMAYINNFSPENTYKIKKLLGVIVESPPYSMNVSGVAEKLGLGRNTVKAYLHALKAAGVINFLNREGKGISTLQKPDKIFLENTNLAFVIKTVNDLGSIRESFMVNQLGHAGIEIVQPKGGGDIYLPEKQVVLEIGGKSKGKRQLKKEANAYIAADDLEIGFMNKIPLYLFGMLY